MKTVHTARIEREDLIAFMNACFAGTQQASFYEPWQTFLTLDFLHEYMSINYRQVYASTLALGINTYNQGKVILNLLTCGTPKDREEATREWYLMLRALDEMPAPQAYRNLAMLKTLRINNRRTRALIRTFLKTRSDLPFHVVKYRRWVKILVGHAHLRVDEETASFLYGDLRQAPAFKHVLYESYRQAFYKVSALFDLPFSVAQGFAAHHGIGRAQLVHKMNEAGKLTFKERQKVQRESAQFGVDVDFDWSRSDPVKIVSYILGMKFGERGKQRAQLEDALSCSVARLVRQQNLSFGRVVVVADRSYSTRGHTSGKNRPLAVAMALGRIFKAASDVCHVLWTPDGQDVDDFMLIASGQTNLARPLLVGLAHQPDLVVVISDGYENDPPGGANAVAMAYRLILADKTATRFVHLNPVMSAGNGELKTLGASFTTMGLRRVEELGVVMQFATYAEGEIEIQELRDVLNRRVDDALSGGAVESLQSRERLAVF